MGTPAYMPPEQATGVGVDERADVYAIGAILYQVLAGRPPYVAASAAELIAALMTGPPAPLGAEVPRELVAIVERAMAREVGRRYRTAAELADDIRRFQTGQLVGAHRYTLRALLRRWMRRHRTLLVAGVVAVAVAVAIGVVALQRIFAADREVDQQRAVALSNQASAEDLMQFMLGDLRIKLKALGRLDLLDAIARRAGTYYDHRGAGLTEADLEAMAKAREGIGSVLTTEADLVAARVQLEQARGAYERLVAEHPQTDRYRLQLASVLTELGSLLAAQADPVKAMGLAKAAVEISEHPLTLDDNRDAARYQQVGAHRLVAELMEARGDLVAATAETRAALAIANAETSPDHGPKDRLDVHSMLGRLVYKQNFDVDAALGEARAGLAIGIELMASQPTVAHWRYDVAVSHSEVANELLRKGDIAVAMAELRLGATLTDRLVELEPSNTVWADARAGIYEKLGLALMKQHDLTNARDAFQVAQTTLHAIAQRDPTNTDPKFQESMMTVHLGDVRYQASDNAGALTAYREALAIREQLVAKDPSNAPWRRSIFYCHYKISSALFELGQRSEARDEMRVAQHLAEAEVKLHPNSTAALGDLEGALAGIGQTSVTLHDTPAAREAFEAALAIERELAKDPTIGAAAAENVKALERSLAKLK